MLSSLLLVGLVAPLVGAQKPLKGPYETNSKIYEVKTLDSTNHKVGVHYPKVAGDPKKFPFISYAHGDGGGNLLTPLGYEKLFQSLASWGYVVAAPWTCDTGCHDDTTSLPHDPRGFAHFYKQQLLVIDWAKEDLTAMANFSTGVGIAGHSMGGQATVFSSSYGNASAYDIKAAVMHHAYTHEYPAPQIPFLAFTGDKDTTAPASMTENFYKASGGNPHRGIVNKKGANHMEPIWSLGTYNPLLPQFTAAWFKVYLDQTPQDQGTDFEAMLFGKTEHSLCGGGDGELAQCEVHQ